jgi:hypothetical protein
MTSSLGEFIHDSSVIIAQVFQESRYESRIRHLEREVDLQHIDHLATPSIIRETRAKVKLVGEYATQTVRELHKTMMYIKDPSNTNPNATIGEDDIPFLKTYFSNLAKTLGGNRSEQIQKERQDYFETWIITNLHESFVSGSKRTVPISDFMAKCANWATDLHSSLNSELQKRLSKPTEVASDDQTLEYVKSRLPCVKNESDKLILSEIVKYQKKQNKLVFVALDYRDLISHASEIAEAIGVRVADPLYALDLLKNPRVGKPVSIPTHQDFIGTR